MSTLVGLFWADSDSGGILAPGRPALSHAELAGRVWGLASLIRQAGVSRADRVAVVLPNGPEMAIAFFGAACAAVCAPLNPAYRRSEFAFYFEDLRPKLLIVQKGVDSPARAVAAEMGVRILELTLDMALSAAPIPDLPAPSDVALVLHTSGTTSRPKIVPLTHANLCASARNIGRTLALTPRDRCLNVMPLFHIHGLIAALLAPLAAGGSVVCAPGFLAPEFFPWIDEFAPTWYSAVPTIHQGVLARAGEHRDIIARRPLRFLRSSSAPLPPSVMADLEAVFGAPVIEAYGMTEASHQMASNPLPPRVRKPGSVGLAAGPEIAILDESGAFHFTGPTPSGEIVIRGDNVTAGYENNPKANAEGYREGWFRTGDVGSLDGEGYLTLSARTKEMINRGGEKIAPREVDEALLRHPGIAQAVAFAMPDPLLGEDVAAAVVLRPGAAAGEAELREFAARTLADFKVPRRIVFLDEIPKGPTGKLQRIGLAEKLGIRAETRPTGRAAYVAPRTPTAEAIAKVWEKVLRIAQVGDDDDFFACGGDSLLAAAVMARLEAAIGKRLPLLSLFQHPVLGRFAAWCDAGEGLPAVPPIGRADRSAPLRASHAQERMWFLLQYEEDAQPYTSSLALRLTGSVDAAALTAAFRAVVQRHEILRTTYRLAGLELYQTINTEAPPLLRMQSEPVQTVDDLRALALAERSRPFDLATDAPLRAVLAPGGAGESYLVFAMQHIASDGWSKSILAGDLAAYYAHFASGAPLALAPLEIQYADYANWEREWLARTVFPAQIEYWKKALDGAPPFLNLPTDYPRPARQTFHGDSADLLIPAALVAQFNEVCRGRQATLYMGLLACFQVVLSRYSGATDVMVGSPIANRDAVETERLIGVFINTVALRADLSDDPSFSVLLDRVREAALGAFENRHVPFAALVEALGVPRSTSHAPVYQTLFQLRNFPSRSAEAAGVAMTEVEVTRPAVAFDFELEATESAAGLGLKLIYNRSLFRRETAEGVLRHYRNLLEAACRDAASPVSNMPLLDAEERGRLVDAPNPAPEPLPPTLPELFELAASAYPQHIAARSGAREWSYGELRRQVHRVAGGLRARGIGPGAIVGVSMPRGLELLAALLGVLEAGAAYLPLDPHFPAERLAFMRADSRLALVIDSLASIAADGDANPPTAPAPESPAYVLYTSGSTGAPKGVVIPHRALANFLVSMARITEFTASDCWLATTTISFDIAGAELFVPLIMGGTVEIAAEELPLDGAALARALDGSRANFWQATPSGWRVLLAANPRPMPHLKGIVGGEELPLDLARRMRPLAGRLWNFYGPTETTIWSTFDEVPSDPQSITIGRPLANTLVYILDRHFEPQPAGVPGELYIGGAGLALGYLGRPDLTAERFMRREGTLLYRTGDLARFLPDGSIEFLGRADTQVKLRGFRVELEEIESAVGRHPGVAEAAAVIHEPAPGDQRLICYYIAGAADPGAETLRELAQRSLPAYMVPSRFLALAEFPRTNNRKLDRKRLAALPLEAVETEFRAPEGPVETRLAGICAELLRRDTVGANADLFDLGAHSLMCAALLARIEQEFGRRIPLPSLFEHPTVECLAAYLSSAGDGPVTPRIVSVCGAGDGVPLFWVKADPAFRALAQRLPKEQPILGLFLPEDHPLPRPYTIEDAAAFHLDSIRERQPRGPYYLGGFCAAGLVAYEIARRMEAAGETVNALILIDTLNPRGWRRDGLDVWIRHQTGQLASKGLRQYVQEKSRATSDRLRLAVPEEDNAAFAELRLAARRYRPGPFGGPVLLVRRPVSGIRREDLGWSRLVPRLRIAELRSTHLGFFKEPQVSELAAVVAAHLAAEVAIR